MGKRILIIQGHPDSGQQHFCHTLEDSYLRGARSSGHEIRCINVARLDFPLLRSQQDWENGVLPASLKEAQEAIKWCEHMVLIFPLWLGDMPALLKGFLEQVARPDFAFAREGKNPFAHKALKGRSAHVIVTMGMPSLLYRWFFLAHSIRSLERNVLNFVGIKPVKETLIGMVGNMSMQTTQKWLDKLEVAGRKGN